MNVKDVIDGLLAGIDDDLNTKEANSKPEPPQEKVASVNVDELEKLAAFLEDAADTMTAAAKEASLEGMIPPNPAAVAEEIQGLTGIDRNESARQQTNAQGATTIGQPKVAMEVGTTTNSLPKPTPPANPSLKSALSASDAILQGVLAGKWPAAFVKRLAQ